MTFHRLDEVPSSREDFVVKESPTINAIAATILFAIAGGALYLGIIKWHPSSGHMSPIAPYFFAGFFALAGLFPLGNFRASMKPSNWLLRCQLSGVLIKYRAYENWKLPSDTLQAVGFEYGEIAWAKLVKERRTEPSSDSRRGSQITWRTYIDLGLANPETTELEANLQAERNLRPENRVIFLDFPVQVLPGGVVEIRWNSAMRPSAKKALEVLGARVKILEVEHRVTDLTRRPNMNPDDEKAKILALARSGDEIGALRLAQQVYGYDLHQAHKFVATLTGRPSLPG